MEKQLNALKTASERFPFVRIVFQSERSTETIFC